MFRDVNENDAGAAAKVWAQSLGRDKNVRVDPVVQVLRGTNAIGEAIRTGAVDVITMTTEEYWHLRHRVSCDTFLYGVKSGSISEQYVLLVHRDSGIQKVADLRGRTLTLFRNPRACLAPVWVETLLGGPGSSRLSGFFGRVTEVNKLSRAVLPVFFRQADACLATRAGFETAAELNPQVGQQLKVLAISPELVPVVCCFRADYHSRCRDQVLAAALHVKSSPAGQQFLTLFQCDDFAQGTESDLNSALELLATYARLTDDSKTAHEPGESVSPGNIQEKAL
jgi:phosphonate transport system substrate-binding protein